MTHKGIDSRGESTQRDITRHHETSGRDGRRVSFGCHFALLSRRFSLFPESVSPIRKDNPPWVPIVSPSSSSPSLSSSPPARVLFYGALCKLLKDWKQHGLCARALRAARLRAVNYYCLVPHAAAASRYAASRSGPGLEKPK